MDHTNNKNKNINKKSLQIVRLSFPSLVSCFKWQKSQWQLERLRENLGETMMSSKLTELVNDKNNTKSQALQQKFIKLVWIRQVSSKRDVTSQVQWKNKMVKYGFEKLLEKLNTISKMEALVPGWMYKNSLVCKVLLVVFRSVNGQDTRPINRNEFGEARQKYVQVDKWWTTVLQRRWTNNKYSCNWDV